MSSTLAIDANNALANMIEQVSSRYRSNAILDIKPSESKVSRLSETPAVSTQFSQDYNGSSIIDRGNVFSLATGGLASMETSTSAPQIDSYNSGAFLVTQTPRTSSIDILKVF